MKCRPCEVCFKQCEWLLAILLVLAIYSDTCLFLFTHIPNTNLLTTGIAALYKYGQSNVNPGDMLFLMRNLATNCSGLHRIAARCGFKKVCQLQIKFAFGCASSAMFDTYVVHFVCARSCVRSGPLSTRRTTLMTPNATCWT